uniref:Chemotaxis response regulator n=1 Tax=uncultured bacterium contig00008 TaxID=1181500 RepID=A0A806JYK6_9BACT|nr:chemotaxis response regulator [uncultured bacterium contig00008]
MSINKKEPLGIKPNHNTPYRVLIIDDSEFIAKQLTKILTSEKFEIAATSFDGVSGLEKYKELHTDIDLVTLDITMPKMDGTSVLEKILEFNKDAKVIMVSALGMEDVVKKCILTGAKNYIKKPFDRAKVLERVASVLKST